MRFAHISDVHVAVRSRWRWRDYFSKRLTSWVNLRFRGRGKAFPHTMPLLEALQAELRARQPDLVVFSGDATALGFREEIDQAANLLGVRAAGLPPGFAVPGNHDYLTPLAARSGNFERAFAPWLAGERLDGAPYPFARRVGPAWFIGVNSCVGNVLPQDARGRVGAAQLARLERLLAQLSDGPRILVTHYPICRPDGQPEKRYHNLRDLADLVRVAEAGRVALWLHGHRHERYQVVPPGVSFPVLCAGSTTQRGVESYCEWTLQGGTLRASIRRYEPGRGAFVTDGALSVPVGS